MHVRRGRDQEQAVASGKGVVAGRSTGHQLLATLQARRHAGAVAAVEQRRDQAQGVYGAGVLGRGQAGHVEPVDQAWQLRAHVQGQLALAGFCELKWQLGRWHGALRNAAEVLLGQAFDLVGGDIADHHQRGIVGGIPGLVPVAQFLDLHALQVGHPADGRGMVAAGRVGHGAEQLEGLCSGLIVGTQAALFLDDLDFLAEFVGWQAQAGQAVGLQFQGYGQAVTRQHLVVGGVVVAGEGVFFRAEVTQDARGLARADLGAALEHHVLQGVRQAGLARGFVAGTDLVPDLRDHHRGAVVFAHHDLEAVVEDEFVGGLHIGGEGRERQAERAEQQASGAAG